MSMPKIDKDLLSKFCRKETLDIIGESDYLYIDNGANILAVCHADTVQDYGRNLAVDVTLHDDKIQSIGLDDRLGLYIILEMLPKMGIVVDVLVTNFEERGMSTASLFETKKEYNWMFSFDRRGLNPVLYQYGALEIEENLASLGIFAETGIYSDICELDFLEITGINFGTGYHLEHCQDCFAMYDDIYYCVNRFSKFYQEFKNELHGAKHRKK